MPTTIGSRAGVCDGDHVVEFYERDAVLAESVADYLAEPLRHGGIAIVIATEAHRRAFARQLAAVGVGPSAVGDQAVAWLDAAEVLETFMPAGRIDGEAFNREVGSVIAKAAAAGGPVRVYGEMVQLLWDAGQVVAALELEGLWNEVIGEHRCSLMCAYRSSSVSGAEHSEALQRVCELHSSIFHPPAGAAVETGHGEALGAEIVAQFLPEPEAPREARRFVTDALRRSGHPAALVDDARLAVSELSTNAVIHARTPFSVAVQSLHRGVRVSVRDASRQRPVIRDWASDPSGGRGLRLVAALATDWGAEATPQGKTVWVQLQPNSPPAHLHRGITPFQAAPPATPAAPGRSTPLSVRAGRSDASELYNLVADTLERSAELLERHAWHEREHGRQREAVAELERSERAREAARRARDLASRMR